MIILKLCIYIQLQLEKEERLSILTPSEEYQLLIKRYVYMRIYIKKKYIAEKNYNEFYYLDKLWN